MWRSLRLIVPALALALALGVAPANAATQTVQMTEQGAGHYVFSPATLTIAVGDTVTWRNTSDTVHTATSNDGVWDSGDVQPGQTFSFTFTKPGTYQYFCKYHRAMGMVGTIVVQAAAGTPAASPTPGRAPGLPSTGGGGSHAGGGLAWLLLGGLGAGAVGGAALRQRRRRSN
ncbi:MAG TPA: plastocyanin/azurin family copper-binding protein [Thermomicrobiales bacterium]|nr:plastocyanin/azurin family copper-binding protein [Thermomicrobiales bacterium]